MKNDTLVPTNPGLSTLHPPVGSDRQPGLKHKEGVGIVCRVCERLVPRQDTHITLTDGSGCVDLKTLEEGLQWKIPIMDPMQPPPDMMRGHAPIPAVAGSREQIGGGSTGVVLARGAEQPPTGTAGTEYHAAQGDPNSRSVHLALRPTGTNDILLAMPEDLAGTGQQQGGDEQQQGGDVTFGASGWNPWAPEASDRSGEDGS